VRSVPREELMQTRPQQALRRLGRTWESPEDPVFVEEWVAGLVPACERCGEPVPVRVPLGQGGRALLHSLLCDACLDGDRGGRDGDDDLYYDEVLVEDVANGSYWAWYPNMNDGQLETFWRQLPRVMGRDDIDDRFPGEWMQLPPEFFRGTLDSKPDRHLRWARVHREGDSWLSLPTRRYDHDADWRVAQRQIVRHRGAPRRRSR
jgi:hypothetical protein